MPPQTTNLLRAKRFIPAVDRLEGRTMPAVFNIANGNVQALINAINTANTNNQTDTINLAAGGLYDLTTVNVNDIILGNSGLPIITYDNGNSLTINGDGATIQRDPAAGIPAFRLLSIDSGIVTISGLTLRNGDAQNGGFAGQGDGGAMLIDQDAFQHTTVVTLDQMLIVNNTSKVEGGGIAVDAGNFTITNSTLTQNTAGGNFDGGGGGLSTDGANTVNIINCTVAQNTVTNGHGGGVAGSFVGAKVMNIINSIVATNTAPGNANDNDLYRATGPLINAVFDIIGAPGTSFLSGPFAVNGNSTGTVFNTNPNLGPLQNNGGQSLTESPLAGSPAINAGSSALASGAFDQRGPGFARVFGPAVDIGALEVQTASPPVSPPGTTSPPTTSPPTSLSPGTVSPSPFDNVIPPGKPTPETPRMLWVGSGVGVSGTVSEIDTTTGAVIRSFMPYGPTFKGGINVTTGDVTGDGVADLICAPASDGGSDVRVYDGVTLNLVTAFLAYPGFYGGVSLAVGDVNGDGITDIITGAGAGGGPHVRVFSGVTFKPFEDFLAYDPHFRGGISVAAGDFDNNGKADIVVGPGAGGGGDVRIFIDGNVSRPTDIWVSGVDYRNGVTVAVGDVYGDGLPDLIVGTVKGASYVTVYSDGRKQQSAVFDAYSGFTGGVHVAAVDPTGSGLSVIATAPGSGGGPDIRLFHIGQGTPALDELVGSGFGGATVG